MYHIETGIAIPRNEILNKNPTEDSEKITLIVTFNRTLLDLRHIINKKRHILQIEPKLREAQAARTPLIF